MKTEQINIAIAEACGWARSKDGWWTHPTLPDAGGMAVCHDYCNDLNAMHEADSAFETNEKHVEYLGHIKSIILRAAGLRSDGHCGDWRVFKATARQRAEAFLRTIGKWKEAE